MFVRFWSSKHHRLNPDEVQVGDFVVELSNNGFYTRA